MSLSPALDMTTENGPKSKEPQQNQEAKEPSHDAQEPVQLTSGKWACNHKCKDKAT